MRVEAADVRARLAGVAQLEAELARSARARRRRRSARATSTRPTSARACAATTPPRPAARTRRRGDRSRARAPPSELRRLLGDDSLEAARTRLAQLEGRLNGHAELAAGRDPDDVERDLGRAREARDRAAAESERLAAAVAERLRTLPDVAALRERLDAADERVARLRARRPRAAPGRDRARPRRPPRPTATSRRSLNASLEAGIARLTAGRYAPRVRGRGPARPRRGAGDAARSSTSTGCRSAPRSRPTWCSASSSCGSCAPGAEALPVLLDDPFAHFDADRLERTLAWLAEAAAERQIIVFCDPAPRGRPRAERRVPVAL